MKKFIFSSIAIFVLLCLFALYQSGYLNLGRVQEQVGSLGAGISEVNTDLVDQVAAQVLSQQEGNAQAQVSNSISTSGASSAGQNENDLNSADGSSSGTTGVDVGGLTIAGLDGTQSLFDLQAVGGTATGRVVPQVEATLSMMQRGNIIQIYVQEGDFVALGDVLLQLDDSFQKADVAENKAELARAKAELAKLQTPARVEEIQAAQASLDTAIAELRRLDDSIIPGQLAIAEASLASAEAGRNQVLDGPSQASVLAASAELEGAELYLEQAQRAYDQVSWRNDVGLLPESQNLQNATVQYNAALAKVRAAQTGATDAEISGAGAQVDRYQAELNMLSAALPAEREALEAEVRYYESRLALLQAGPVPADVDAANARVEAAEARLASSMAELTNTALRAPFSGTVAIIEPNIGERVEVGTPVIRLADLTSWQIETSDLSELDIANLVLGSRTTLQFDAIPDLAMTGFVKSIRPFGEDTEGDTYYKAIILPDQPDERLRWNMTAFVTFESAVTDSE